MLHESGFRTFSPWLRGFGPTSFLSKETMRSGEIAAMAQDVLDFADALGISRFAVVGHDWGARISYLLASVFRTASSAALRCPSAGNQANQQRRRPNRRKHFGINGSWRPHGAPSSYERTARNSPGISGTAGVH
ncbi:alpha/beta fold hydrolase [Mesorhizobium sp. M7A.F.Ca.US.003.02.1.1]